MIAATILLVPSQRPTFPEAALLALFSERLHGKTPEEGAGHKGAILDYIRVRQLEKTGSFPTVPPVGYGFSLRIQAPKGFYDECY
jgi:hypothetical protein